MLVFRDGALTYRRLGDRASALAILQLERHGAGPDLLVGVCIER